MDDEEELLALTALYNDAVDQAVTTHFCKLFEVLMSNPSDASLARFKKGFENLVVMGFKVREIVNNAD